MIASIPKPIRTECANCTTGCQGLLDLMDEAGKNILRAGKRSRAFAKNQVLFNEGDTVTGFFEIRKGLVRTCRLSYGAREQTFDIYRAGDTVGLRDCLLGARYHHSCVALQETEVCFFDAPALKQAVSADPAFQGRILEYLANEWCNAEDRMYSLGTKPVHGRVAELLLSLRPCTGSNEVRMDFTRETMASILGTSTETVIRTISDFKARNWIESSRDSLKITNVPELCKLADVELEPVALAV